MPDYLSCGSCPQDFELSDITQFIEHKRWSCTTSRDTAQFAINLLECVKCFRKFNTPWPLLIHIQLDHQLNVVRNLFLPRQQTAAPPPLSARQPPQQQQNPPPESMMDDLETSAEHRSVTTQTRTTSIQRSRCYATCCQKSEPIIPAACNDDDSSCSRCPCVENVKPTCCLPPEKITLALPQQQEDEATTSGSCCQQQQSGQQVGIAASKKSGVVNEAASCCPCPPKVETHTQDCQTDFEYFDFDMDLLLGEDQLTMTPTPSVVTSTEPGGGGEDQMADNTMSSFVQTGGLIQNIPANRGIWSGDEMPMLPLLNSSGSTTQAFYPNSGSTDQQQQHFQPSSSSATSNTTADVIFTGIQQPQQQQQQHLNLPSRDAIVDNTSTLLPPPTQQQHPDCSQSQTISRPLQPLIHHRKLIRESRFICQQCSKPFRQNVHLRKHVMAQHTNQKPHKCPHCGYTTVEKSHLTVHIRTHTGEKPFRCRNCTYSSAQNCTLKSHYLRRHPGSSVICEICGDGYITEQEKNNHQKTCREMATSTVME